MARPSCAKCSEGTTFESASKVLSSCFVAGAGAPVAGAETINGAGYPECGSPRAITASARVMAGRFAASGVDSESNKIAASKRIVGGT